MTAKETNIQEILSLTDDLALIRYKQGLQGEEYQPFDMPTDKPKSDKAIRFEKELNVLLKRGYDLGKLEATQEKAPSTTGMVRERI